MQDVVQAVRCGKGVSDRECEISEIGATQEELYIFVEMCRRYAVLRLDKPAGQALKGAQRREGRQVHQGAQTGVSGVL